MPSLMSWRMAAESLARARHFDERVRPVERCPQPPRLGHRAGGVVRQVRIDLQADVAVSAFGAIKDAAKLVGSAAAHPAG